MPHLARHLALAACLTLIGATAEAAPKRAGKVVKAKKKVAPPVEETDEETDDDDADATADDDADEEIVPDKKSKAARAAKEARSKRHKKSKSQQVGMAEDTEADLVDAPVKVRKRAVKGVRNWNIAVGPNVWMASVDAKVTVGAKDISTAIDFFALSRHTKVGVPLLIEGRYKRFSFVGDVLYGVVALEGGNDIGPLMVTLDGTVTNWLFDGMGGYRFLGTDASKVSVEARAGVRYQRIAVNGSLGISGSSLPAAIVDAGTDYLAGARVFVRPHRRVHFTGTVDQSLFGSSTSTWSASIDATVQVSRLLVTAGWRTLTQQSNTLSTVMHGPKLALALLF